MLCRACRDVRAGEEFCVSLKLKSTDSCVSEGCSSGWVAIDSWCRFEQKMNLCLKNTSDITSSSIS